MPDKTCSTCGFLAVRVTKTRQLVDAEDSLRITGFLQCTGNDYRYDHYPICFVRAFNLAQEIGTTSPLDTGTRLDVLRKPRNECQEFTPWQQGFTPKEHREMIDRQWMLQHEADRSESERKWKEEQATLARRHNNRSLSVSVVAMLIAFGGLLLAVLRSPPSPVPIQVQFSQPKQAAEPPAEPEPTPTID